MTLQRSSQRKARTSSTGGWQKVDLNDVEVEGFEDGCAFDLEELTDYHLEQTEAGGHILVSSSARSDPLPGKKKRKRSKTARKDAQQSFLDDGDASDSGKNIATASTSEDFNVESASKHEQSGQPRDAKSAARSESAEQSEKPKKKAKKAAPPVVTKPLPPVDLPKWSAYKLHNTLLHALKQAGFVAPTRIQEQTIYPALVDNRDVVGAAPTGSGKTLAFGLPILSQLLVERGHASYKKDCKALILTPTRELALQIHQHLEKMVPNREIGIVTLVGGMAVQKQKRLLTYAPEIVIGTPGRLWDLIDQKHPHFADLNSSLRFLVVDEADRMLQTGSYPEVEKIFDALRFNPKRGGSELVDMSEDEDEAEGESGDDDEDEDADNADGKSCAFSNGKKVMMLDDVLKLQAKREQKEVQGNGATQQRKAAEAGGAEPARTVRQTFLFSATLTIPEGGRFQTAKKKHRHALTVLESVMKRVGMRGKPAVVDLSIDESAGSGSGSVAELTGAETEARRKRQAENVSLSLPAGLELCQYEVSEATRDSFLYFFLTQYPGRTIVFLNAIQQVRRLAGLLALLGLPVFALHAEMQQRQRLKKLDNFRAHAKGILVATDVAARGLDIPSVDYVVHYHIARSTEVFVHRSGRTARAEKEGLSISLVGPADAKYHAQICKVLQRPTGLSDFPFDHRFAAPVDERVRLAKAISEQESATGKVKSEETWFSQMAAAADLDLDDNLVQELKAKSAGSKKAGKNGTLSVEAQRAQLSQLLAEPLRPVGSTRKFRQLHQELGRELAGDGEYRKRNASDDLESKSKKVALKRFRKRK
ncbi:hypothetical protein PybrP1_000925 [[Pythium] brassicae (nom. inval.)]|nr:hypothetical protein PybrP1_000925 [[Pythium] brassicae (nom. inval.)]